MGIENEISNLDTAKLLIQIFREKYRRYLILDVDSDESNKSKEYIHSIEFVRDRAINDFRYRIDSSKLKQLGWYRKIDSFKEMFEKPSNGM